MDSITVKAPAKVNLFLKILGRREDGYHKIETLFEKIALFDRIILKKKAAGGIVIHSDNIDLPKDRRNLAYKAAAALCARYRIPGVSIEIGKSIPIGAGLGGGSSDAAAVFSGMKRLYGLDICAQEVKVLAGEIGADVPFFAAGDTWAAGREKGEETEGIDTKLKLWHILIVPPFSVMAKEAYDWSDTAGLTNGCGIKGALSAVEKSDIDALGRSMRNDLEGFSFLSSQGLKRLKERLIKYGAKGAMVTGSGPALFAIADKEKEVVRLKEALRKEGITAEKKRWQIFIVPTLNTASPFVL